MAANRVTINERKDLEKYVRFFVIKAVQVIVQSRLGERISTHCKTDLEGSDWFNLGIRDHREVSNEVKKCLADVQLLSSFTMNIEISLKTSEDENMVLEVWSINMDPSTAQSVKINFVVYNKLSMLLKSLICITRMGNVYQLSRRQSADSYIICYRVYHGPPSLIRLGSNEKKVKVGHVSTPVGSVGLSTTCRTHLSLSPVTSLQDLDVKENYFSHEPSEISTVKNGHILTDKQLNNQMYKDDYSEYNMIYATSPPDGDIPNDFTESKPKERSVLKDSPHNKIFKLGGSSSDNTDSSGSGTRVRTPDKFKKIGAFAPRRASQVSLEEEVPFSILLEMSQQGTNEPSFPDNVQTADIKATECISQSILDEPDFLELENAEEYDFVDLKTPFAVPDGETDLGRFYRSCQTRPELDLFHRGPTISDTLADLDLDQFEKNLVNFDDFFNQISLHDVDHSSPV